MLVRKIFVNSLLAASIALLSSQVIGLAQPAVTSPSEGSIPGYNFPTSSQQLLLRAVTRGSGINTDSFGYVKDLTDLVYSSMAHGEATSLHPTHSWVGYVTSKIWGESLMYTQNPLVIAGSGVAICSQSARVVTEIAKKDGVEARIVGLGGHVVAEIFIGGTWKMSDPDYGIAFDGSVVQASESGEIVGEELRRRGHSEAAVTEYLRILGGDDKLWRGVWAPDEPKPWVIERWGVFLSWLIPMAGIGLGLVFRSPRS